jgi:hypothetical protein
VHVFLPKRAKAESAWRTAAGQELAAMRRDRGQSFYRSDAASISLASPALPLVPGFISDHSL